MPFYFRRKKQKEDFDWGDFQEVTSRKEVIKEFIWELIKVVVISLAIIIPVRYFLIQPFYVKGASMEPNFYDHEYLIINEISYRFEEPQRGDIVVFKYPRDPKQYFIKRIVALPGERIEISNNQIRVHNKEKPEGVILNESMYLDSSARTWGEMSVLLGPEEYFVLGDNRSSSVDSRQFGSLKKEFIIGKTWLRGWPFDRINIFESPVYNF